MIDKPALKNASLFEKIFYENLERCIALSEFTASDKGNISIISEYLECEDRQLKEKERQLSDLQVKLESEIELCTAEEDLNQVIDMVQNRQFKPVEKEELK